MTRTPGHTQEDSALALMALTLQPQAPPPALRDRLLASVSGPERYLPFAADLSGLFDLPFARMQALLRSLARPDTWQRSAPGIGLVHFAAGPAIVDRHAGFVRMRAGFEISDHRHRVEEVTYVLEGLLVESSGTVCGPGECLRNAPGSVHGLTLVEDSVLATLVGPTERLRPDEPAPH